MKQKKNKILEVYYGVYFWADLVCKLTKTLIVRKDGKTNK